MRMQSRFLERVNIGPFILTKIFTLTNAREWVLEFVHWYNVRHHHRGIKFMTHEQHHKGDDKKVTMERTEIYEAAKNKHPERWSGQTRNWELPQEVILNPETNSLAIKQAL
jgi:putative transposase